MLDAKGERFPSANAEHGSARWLSTTLRAIGEGVITCGLDQVVSFVNPAALHILGISEDGLLGRTVLEAVGGSAASGVADALGKRASTQFVLEMAQGAASGTRVVQASASPLVHDDVTLGAVVVLHDITEQRRRDEQVALTDRLSSLGALVSSVAHDVNNPLAYTLGNLELAVSDLQRVREMLQEPTTRELIEGVISDLQDATEGAERIANTVRELRNFGRIEEGARRPVDPRACVEWALRLTGNQLMQHARAVRDLRDVPRVMANELKLSQVVVNLLTNALHGLARKREENQIKVTTWTDDEGRAVIEVEDNGRGMTETERRLALEPFFSAQGKTSGSGFGLSICRAIVESFDGSISVESQVERGSCFRVVLPPCADEAAARTEARASALEAVVPARPRSGRPSRVLVIDDDQMIRQLVTRVLSKSCEVTVVESVRAALAELNEAEDFDAILCDLTLPGESGMEFFGVLCSLYPKLVARLAFITAGAMTAQASKFLESAGRPVLNKPFGSGALSEMVERLTPSSVIPAPGQS